MRDRIFPIFGDFLQRENFVVENKLVLKKLFDWDIGDIVGKDEYVAKVYKFGSWDVRIYKENKNVLVWLISPSREKLVVVDIINGEILLKNSAIADLWKRDDVEIIEK